MQEIKEIPIGKIKVGENEQRLNYDDEDIDSLAASISRIGVVNPILVSDVDGVYTIIAGHRRFAAARKACCSSVPCIVQVCEKEMAVEITFAENFFRKDLSPVELASALKDAAESRGLSMKDLARGFHRSEHWVQQMIAICDWPGDVLAAIHLEQISISAGSNLAVVTDNTYRGFLVRNAVEQGATARTTASWLQAWRVMQPAEEAITSEPVDGRPIPQPAVPQAPCFCCAQIFPVNEVSHVPICGGCVQIIRALG